MPCPGENIPNQAIGKTKTDVSRRDVIALQNGDAREHTTLLTRNVGVGNIFKVFDQLEIVLGTVPIVPYNAIKGGLMPVFPPPQTVLEIRQEAVAKFHTILPKESCI